MAQAERGRWGSRLGFILAASGSAIGLGNIVFFGANAYKFGGGAFYVPYLVALFVVGIPVMMLEFGIGHRSQRSFPLALRELAGPAGEVIGWFALVNALVITMYYLTMLAWVAGMLIGSFGPLWEATAATPALHAAGGPEAVPNPYGFFFHTLSTPSVLGLVVIIWMINIAICWRGTKTIEAAVKFFVPAMWVMMIVLIVRGLTLPNGGQGVLYLFTPDFSAMGEPEVWRGAFSQIFFSLSLGFGVLTTYASYLPKDSDTPNFALQTSLMNCSFEYIAGFAIFSMLFAFAIIPKASTLSMSFFVLPQGIQALPGGTAAIYGVLFFVLLLFAGLSSSVSLLEGLTGAILDKFGGDRLRVMGVVFVIGLLGSAAFAWPKVIDPNLNQNGTLGLTLLDLFDHNAFGYGLLLVGLAECLIVGWGRGGQQLLEHFRATSRVPMGTWFLILIRYVIPAALTVLLGLALWDEVQNGPYGKALVDEQQIGASGLSLWWLPASAPLIWLLVTLAGAAVLGRLRAREATA